MQSQAQVLVAPATFALRTLDIPAPGPGQVRLRVHACGICGSDKLLAQVSAPGTILGHEVIGEIESCGAGVTAWRRGERVVPLGDGLGMSDQRGGFSEWIVIAAGNCVRVPEPLPSLHAVLAEPLGNGLHFVRRGRLPAEHDDLTEATADALGGRPQLVLQAVGCPDVMAQAVRLPGPGGAVVVLAGMTLDALPIRPLPLCLKETDLVFPIGTTAAEVEEALAVMAADEVPAARFTSHRIRQAEIPTALHDLGRPAGQVKVVVDYLSED